ncbi:MAG TPA: LysE/ArgO family amino acid transporter [Symbiobacteriaceae bacterium]|nr:LysE/ArgO family amino acid transporter [Symbiobacteriaceae bacterium]
MLAAVVHGFLLAFGLILPLGVQNTFVFTQGALHRRWAGALPSVLTAAACDTLLITLAVSGLSLVVLAVPWFQSALSWVGVAFLLYMGWATWRTEPATENAAEEWPARRQITFAASVSLLNPHAILDTVAVIGTNSLSYTGAPRLGFALACIGVSWLWFLGLATAGYLLGISAGGLSLRRWLNRISALIMWGVAVQLVLTVIGR